MALCIFYYNEQLLFETIRRKKRGKRDASKSGQVFKSVIFLVFCVFIVLFYFWHIFSSPPAVSGGYRRIFLLFRIFGTLFVSVTVKGV